MLSYVSSTHTYIIWYNVLVNWYLDYNHIIEKKIFVQNKNKGITIAYKKAIKSFWGHLKHYVFKAIQQINTATEFRCSHTEKKRCIDWRKHTQYNKTSGLNILIIYYIIKIWWLWENEQNTNNIFFHFFASESATVVLVCHFISKMIDIRHCVSLPLANRLISLNKTTTSRTNVYSPGIVKISLYIFLIKFWSRTEF